MLDYFVLFANCMPVKGITRSLICDLQRNQYWFIPEGLYDILTEDLKKRKSVSSIKIKYKNKFDEVIDEYFEFLVSNELGFFTTQEELDNFPLLNLEWDEPSLITNSIIDFNSFSKHNTSKIFDELEELGCKFIQLRFFNEVSIEQIDSILKQLKLHRIISVELILPYQNNEISDSIIENVLKHPRVNQIVFHGSFKNSNEIKNDLKIINVTSIIESESHCGIISSKYFTLNIKTFTESQNYNTCLNRKISIDVNGLIKNCPSLSKSFGCIEENSLNTVVKSEDFKKLWQINKDEIDVCKICEFRYICTDCRAYLENPKNIYSKPLKCGYDPVTCTWEDWSKNSLKKNAIDSYNINLTK